jgi:hypothetical protein
MTPCHEIGNLFTSASDTVQSLSTQPFEAGGSRSEWPVTTFTANHQDQLPIERVRPAALVRYGQCREECKETIMENRWRAT